MLGGGGAAAADAPAANVPEQSVPAAAPQLAEQAVLFESSDLQWFPFALLVPPYKSAQRF